MDRPVWVREDITEVDWLRQKLNEEVKYSGALVEGVKKLVLNWLESSDRRSRKSPERKILIECADELSALVTSNGGK